MTDYADMLKTILTQLSPSGTLANILTYDFSGAFNLPANSVRLVEGEQTLLDMKNYRNRDVTIAATCFASTRAGVHAVVADVLGAVDSYNENYGLSLTIPQTLSSNERCAYDQDGTLDGTLDFDGGDWYLGTNYFSGGNSKLHSFMRFPMSSLPGLTTGAVVHSATLTLTSNNESEEDPLATVRAHAIAGEYAQGTISSLAALQLMLDNISTAYGTQDGTFETTDPVDFDVSSAITEVLGDDDTYLGFVITNPETSSTKVANFNGYYYANTLHAELAGSEPSLAITYRPSGYPTYIKTTLVTSASKSATVWYAVITFHLLYPFEVKTIA